jgi:hypothetical protein
MNSSSPNLCHLQDTSARHQKSVSRANANALLIPSTTPRTAANVVRSSIHMHGVQRIIVHQHIQQAVYCGLAHMYNRHPLYTTTYIACRTDPHCQSSSTRPLICVMLYISAAILSPMRHLAAQIVLYNAQLDIKNSTLCHVQDTSAQNQRSVTWANASALLTPPRTPRIAANAVRSSKHVRDVHGIIVV